MADYNAGGVSFRVDIVGGIGEETRAELLAPSSFAAITGLATRLVLGLGLIASARPPRLPDPLPAGTRFWIRLAIG